MAGGAIGQQEARRFVERHIVRDLDGGVGRDDGPRGVAAIEHHRQDAVALFEIIHAFPDGFDDAGNLAARCEGAFRLELVHVGDDQQVREIHARGVDTDGDFAGAGGLVLLLGQGEAVRASGLGA